MNNKKNASKKIAPAPKAPVVPWDVRRLEPWDEAGTCGWCGVDGDAGAVHDCDAPDPEAYFAGRRAGKSALVEITEAMAAPAKRAKRGAR